MDLLSSSSRLFVLLVLQLEYKRQILACDHIVGIQFQRSVELSKRRIYISQGGQCSTQIIVNDTFSGVQLYDPAKMVDS